VTQAPKRGDVIEIRTLIGHPMETGFRTTGDGARVPRDLIRKLTCRYEGEVVFSAELFPATAANPFVAFHTVATESGTLSFTWEGDNGFNQTETVAIRVT
jgi:sulfur-oxidizing protein SoxZ